MTIGKTLSSGVLQGASVWFTYGVVEYAFLTPGGLLLAPDALVTEWHSRISLLLFASYGVLGAVLGSVLALLLRPRGVQSPDQEMYPKQVRR